MMNAFAAQRYAEQRYSPQQFHLTLKSLMEERGLSYRQLAYKTNLSAGYLNHLTKGTRPTPADAIIEVLAGSLYVQPDYFLEYRLRRVYEALEQSPLTTDELYETLVLKPSRVKDASSTTTKGISLCPDTA